MIAPIRAPRPPHGLSIVKSPRAPSGAPKAPKIAEGQAVSDALLATPETPPQWTQSQLEWVVWYDLTVRRGWKIFGRPNVRGRTEIYEEADAVYQPALPVPQLNISGKGFRADFWIIPGKKGPSPGPPFSRGLVFDPVTLWTHPDAGKDRMRRSLLAKAGYQLIWFDGAQLQARPHELITAALFGSDDSSIDRGQR